MHIVGILSLPALMIVMGFLFAYAARQPRPEADPEPIVILDTADIGDDPVIRAFVGLVKWLLLLVVIGGTLVLLLVKGLP